VRPSIAKSATDGIQPFYLTRSFSCGEGDRFRCVVINFADPNARVPLVKIDISGHLVWKGPHPIADGAFMVDYVAAVAYEVTPLHSGVVDAFNHFPAAGLKKWEVNGMLFNGSKNVDGRPFDKPENRPTNLQLPLVRR
jgi:hypothetical protein